MIRRWKPYQINEPIAGLVVIGYEQIATTQRETVYQVKHNCCGKTGTISHHQITGRLRRGVKFCIDCHRQNFNEYARVSNDKRKAARHVAHPYGVTPPPWKPISGSAGKRWIDRR